MASLPSFEVSVKSSPVAVREALNSLLEALAPLNLCVEDAGTVEMVLAEALNNIVEHAYPKQNSRGMITISCSHHGDGLHFRIIDEGEEMPDGVAPLGTQPSLEVGFKDLPEGGFGWPLIDDLAKDVKFQRIGTENQLSMRVAVALEHQERR